MTDIQMSILLLSVCVFISVLLNRLTTHTEGAQQAFEESPGRVGT